MAQRGVARAMEKGIDPGDWEAIKGVIDEEAKLAFELRPDGRLGRLDEVYDYASSQQTGFGGRTIKRVGDEATFQEPNALATGMNSLLRDPRAAVLKPFVPFVKTPLNILNQGLMESTLIGPILQVSDSLLSPTGTILDIQQKLLRNPAETARVAGQITFMTSVMSLLYMKSMDGTITGGGPQRWGVGSGSEQRDAQRAWERANIPYSIKFGDTYVPFDRWPEPFATFMRMAADFGSAAAYMKEEERDSTMGTLVGIGAASLYNSSMLSGINTLIDTFKEPGKVDQRMGENVQYWFATQTPLSGLMSYVDQIEDPYRSAYQETGLQYMLDFEDIFGRGVLGKVAERFPGGSTVRPVQIDQIYGQPVPVSPGFGPQGLNPALKAIPFLPRTLGESGHDEAWQAAFEMGGGWREFRPRQSNLELSPEQQMELNKTMGTMKIDGRTLSQAIMQLRRSPEAQRIIDGFGGSRAESGTGLRDALNELKSRYGNAALMRLLRNNPTLREQQALKETLRKQKRNNNLEAANTTSQRIKQLLEIARAG